MISAPTILHGDCLEMMAQLADGSVDAVVTDPPYGLSFMGRKWDYDVPSVEVWAECLRVLKPGGHLLAFAGTRTQHRMAVRIEDAGFDIRDMIAWVYGSGFPKSLDVSKAIDKSAGAEREVIGIDVRYNEASGIVSAGRDERALIERKIPAPATDAARQWQGWGTALKPALEPITVARKPLAGTVAENVLAHGTGAMNIDECRVEALDGYAKNAVTQGINTAQTPYAPAVARRTFQPSQSGRWPANLIHDGSEEVVGLLPDTKSGSRKAGRHVVAGGANAYAGGWREGDMPEIVGDTGSAARFFYCAKASKRDRDEGCDSLRTVRASEITGRAEGSAGLVMEGGKANPYAGTTGEPRKNHHPTVKPTDLMRYLCRLVTPPGGIVLDPFMGSGSTGRGAVLEGFRFIGIEREAEYVEIARARIASVGAAQGQFQMERRR